MTKEHKRGNGDTVLNERKNGTKSVPWYVFALVIGVLITGIGWALLGTGRLDARVNKVEDSFSVIKEQIGRMDENIGWIREAIKELRR